ncbi:MAG: ABC transporter permease [Verrucomicrobiales bacterium]
MDKLNLLFLAAQAALIGGLVGWVSDDPGLRMFLAVIATLWFGCSNAAQQIVSELPIFRRERVSGLGLNAYIQSKFVFLFAITSLQSVALLVAVVGSAAYFHPLDLPDDDQAFLAGIYERLHPAQIATAEQVRAAGGPLRTGDSISEGGGRAFAIEEPEEIDLGESRFTSDGRQMADAGDWQIRALMFLARHFQMEPNLLESADQRARQVFATADEPATGVSRGIPLPRVIGVCLGLRLAALQLAALVGVSMGLAISALAQSNTQAVMWVPLVLIPQILFGAFVVALPEMPRSARLFCQAMPSFAAQRLIDVGHLYGQRTPKMTNLTRIPSYLSNEKAPRDTEEVRWTQAGEEKETEFEKISVHNTSWQNLAVLHDLVGQHEKQRDSSADEVKSVNRRNDSLYRRFDVYANTGPAAISAGVLGGWIASCYVIIGLSLLRRQYGK